MICISMVRRGISSLGELAHDYLCAQNYSGSAGPGLSCKAACFEQLELTAPADDGKRSSAKILELVDVLWFN
jgi:hypothetical protein